MKALATTACLLVLVVSGTAASQELFEEGDRIANEGTIGDKWKLAEGETLEMASYPAQFAPRGADVCIGLGYRIDVDGSTGGFAVLRQWNSEGADEPEPGFWQAFSQAAADAVSQWRFAPKPGAGAPRPTYTAATIVFSGGKAQADAAAHCRIADLPTVVQERKSEGTRRSRATHDLERAGRSRQVRGSMNENPGRLGSRPT